MTEYSLDDAIYVAVVRSRAPKNGQEVKVLMEAFREAGVDPVVSPQVLAFKASESGSRHHDALVKLGLDWHTANSIVPVVMESPVDAHREKLTEALTDLTEAVQPVLAAYRATETGHITKEQITAAWSAHDAARNVVRGEYMTTAIPTRLVLHCPICQYQYDAGPNGAPTRCPNGPAALVEGGRTRPWTFNGHGDESYVKRYASDPLPDGSSTERNDDA